MLRAVSTGKGYAVSGSHALLEKVIGQAVGALMEIQMRESASLLNNRELFGKSLRVARERVSHVHLHRIFSLHRINKVATKKEIDRRDA
jgi:hypothetical protein